MQVFVAKNGQQTGPFEADQVIEMIKSRELKPDDFVWHTELADWQPASSIFDFSVAGQTSPAASMHAAALGVKPSTPGTAPGASESFSFDHRAAWQQATAKPASASAAPAGRGQRLVAGFVDSFVFAVAVAPALLISLAGAHAESIGGIVAGVFLGVLCAVTLAVIQLRMLTKEGQTIGKRAMSVRIVTFEGEENPGFGKAVVLRGVVPGAIGAIPIVGGIFSLVDILFIFRSDKRCIHDLLAGTKVVLARPA